MWTPAPHRPRLRQVVLSMGQEPVQTPNKAQKAGSWLDWLGGIGQKRAVTIPGDIPLGDIALASPRHSSRMRPELERV